MNSISTFDITKYPLLDILKDIKNGRIQLPDFQRDWVWDDARIKRLLTSLSLAYPVGAVMLLQQGNPQVRFKPRLVDGATLQQPPAPNLLILDGQQRLTTLFMVLLSEQPVLVKDSNSNKLSRKWYYLDIEKSLDPNSDRKEAILALPESKKLYLRGEARAACDVVEMPVWLSGGAVSTTVTSARFSVERLLNAKKRYGAVYQGLSALLRLSGAVDWSTGEEINDVLYFEQGVESHHIFPVAWCRKYGIDPKKYNCLVNRTPLSAKTNKKIGSKAPSVYLKEFEMSGTSPEKLDDMLRSHAIEPSLLRNDDIERFFTARTKALMELIEKAMGQPLTIEAFETSAQHYTNEYTNGNGNGFIHRY
jgi:hypothetical protein